MAGVAGSGLASVLSSPHTAFRQHAERPNVLVFFTDQQRWDTVGCYGSPMDITQNLDGFARRGVLLRNAFTCQPVCAPARASLQTGKYALAASVWRNGLRLPASEKTLAHWFAEAGYRVGYIGKWHLANTGAKPVPKDARGGYVDLWEAADVLEHLSHPYDPKLYDAEDKLIQMEGYRVDALTERAIRFVTAQSDRPFFLFLSFLEPHHQNDMNAYVAPEGYAKRFANPWVPPDLRDRPGDWYESLPNYYGCIARLDECLGRLMEALEKAGKAQNTIVLFTTDHGCHFRTRNSEYKRSCHDSSVRIPAVMWGPGLPAGTVVDELVSLVDLPPTLLQAAGLIVPGSMQGRSILPLRNGERDGWPEEVYIQISEAEVGRAIRTHRWK
ncbi:MAG: sulfatase-like hydrolase/transferase, partial [Armatimonadota bacterium]